jgi:hypothetical protein
MSLALAPACIYREVMRWFIYNATRGEDGTIIQVPSGRFCWECGTIVEAFPLSEQDEVVRLYKSDHNTKIKVPSKHHNMPRTNKFRRVLGTVSTAPQYSVQN